MDLFEDRPDTGPDPYGPLADRMRPAILDDIVGQTHLISQGSLLRTAIENDQVFSMILWGPPGCGKTTLAGIIARETRSVFVQISAVLSGVKEVRQIIEEATRRRNFYSQRTILFVDEIHRFNKAQQDAFLHHVEKGVITLVGATTENPSFEVIPALVSRCRVFVLHALKQGEMVAVLRRALTDTKQGLNLPSGTLSEEALAHIAAVSDGDARIALANLETAVLHFPGKHQIDIGMVEKAVEKKSLLYDKAGEEHYNLISAFIKSMRGSDPDAAIYWMERMLASGDDPYYLIRRMIRFATEDVGMADPGALTMALNAGEAYRMLGHPEGDEALFQAAVYLATAPKSNSVYAAHNAMKKAVKKAGHLPVPHHIRNAPTQLMKQEGYGRGYQYAHDDPDGYIPQSYLPDEISDLCVYHPTGRGYEKVVKQRLDGWKARKKNQR